MVESRAARICCRKTRGLCVLLTDHELRVTVLGRESEGRLTTFGKALCIALVKITNKLYVIYCEIFDKYMLYLCPKFVWHCIEW